MHANFINFPFSYNYPSTFWESVASRDYRSLYGHVDSLTIPETGHFDVNYDELERMRSRREEDGYYDWGDGNVIICYLKIWRSCILLMSIQK